MFDIPKMFPNLQSLDPFTDSVWALEEQQKILDFGLNLRVCPKDLVEILNSSTSQTNLKSADVQKAKRVSAILPGNKAALRLITLKLSVWHEVWGWGFNSLAFISCKQAFSYFRAASCVWRKQCTRVIGQCNEQTLLLQNILYIGTQLSLFKQIYLYFSSQRYSWVHKSVFSSLSDPSI